MFLLILDGLRADRASCYGYSRKTTPYIDLLAKQGILFSNCYGVSHSSFPCHISLFTGVHPYFHGAASNFSYYNNQLPYLTEKLQKQNYKTIGISSYNSYHSIESGFLRYFDKYIKVMKSNSYMKKPLKPKFKHGHNMIDLTGLSDFAKKIWSKIKYSSFKAKADFYLKNDMGGKKIIDQIKKQFDLCYGSDEPFFLFANILETHTPFLPIGKFRNYFKKINLTKTLLNAFFNPHLFETGRAPLSSEEQEALNALYDGGVRYADSLVEELFSYLDEKGYLDNTTVIITSDHGEMLNEQDSLIGHGSSTYEGMIKLPLIILDSPKRNQGMITREDLVSQVDIFPTIVNIAGGTLDRNIFKYKCKDLLKNDETSRFVICESPATAFPERLYGYPEIMERWGHVERTIIEKPYKFIWRSNGNHCLYDLSVDKIEKNNLFRKADPGIIKELICKMVLWYKEQCGDEDFFSLECFDYQKTRWPGKPVEDLIVTQDEGNIEVVQDEIR